MTFDSESTLDFLSFLQHPFCMCLFRVSDLTQALLSRINFVLFPDLLINLSIVVLFDGNFLLDWGLLFDL